MKLGSIALLVALLLAAVAGQNSLLQSTEAEDDTAITACAVQGGHCDSPLDSSPGSTVLDHVVFTGGCHTSDLHVVRYVPEQGDATQPLVAQWCS